MEEKKSCLSCGHWQVVSARYGISLASLGMTDKYCSSCLEAELDALGLIRRWRPDDDEEE